mmetsp:Transcript_10004/g.17707  ORF Transcript_10004/g.17707 Transcript_10004/m.17707 type:complete len:122 (+) Transcript_10004:401-766(+)
MGDLSLPNIVEQQPSENVVHETSASMPHNEMEIPPMGNLSLPDINQPLSGEHGATQHDHRGEHQQAPNDVMHTPGKSTQGDKQDDGFDPSKRLFGTPSGDHEDHEDSQATKGGVHKVNTHH